jgi:hypothetical protein
MKEETTNARLRSVFNARSEAKRTVCRPFQMPPDRLNGPETLFPRAETVNETPDETGDGSDGFDYRYAAEADFRAVCANLTGTIIADEAFQTVQERLDAKDAQSITLANALDATGRYPTPFNRGPKDPGACCVIGVFTGAVRPLPALRRVCFLPSIAAMLRSKMLRDAEHFLDCHPTACRLFTMTHGERVVFESVDQFRAVIQAHTRRISRMNTLEPFRRWHCPYKDRRRLGRAGWRQQAQIELRGLEYGSPEFIGGKLTLHIHSHLVVRELRVVTGKQRANFRRQLWRRWGKVWDDAGTIQNAREFVKYPVKPADLDVMLRDGGPGLLADFYEAVRGLHHYQPSGELRQTRRLRRTNARRITAFRRLDGRTLEETGDWNAEKRPFAPVNARRNAWLKRKREEAAWRLAEFRLSVPTDPETETPVYSEGNAHRPPDNRRAAPRVANRILSRVAPGPYGSPVFEPGVVVWGFDGNLAAVLEQPRVAAMREQHAEAWNNAQAARALIRACAAAPAASEGSQRSSNCPCAETDPLPGFALFDGSAAHSTHPPPEIFA